jgi:AcrR family transcriptional regulator
MTPRESLSRERIVAASMELATTLGFAATSLRQIADRLDVTVAALYYHYRTKDDLLADLVRPYLERVDAIVATSGNEPDPVGYALREVLELTLTAPDLVRVATRDPAVVGHALQGPELEERMRSLRSVLMGRKTSTRAEVLASAALGVVIRPLLNLADVPPETARRELVPAAIRVLTAT